MTLQELAIKSTLKNVEQSGFTVPIQQSYTKEQALCSDLTDSQDL